MALFSSYAKPGVYTDVLTVSAGVPLFGDARIAVLIGEGQENFVFSNVELHRGSSAVADDKVVTEDLSAQVDGNTRSFQLGYFPLVKGDGQGNTNVQPTDVQVTADGVPVIVQTVTGKTGVFTTQQIIPLGTSVLATYYFKRMDTKVIAEDLSVQIPSFSSLSISATAGSPPITGVLNLTLSIPGELGNNVSLTLTDGSLASPPVTAADVVAVSGVGTDAISIELRKTDNSLRTVADVATLINAGIPTLSGGYLVVTSTTGTTSTPMTDDAAVNFAGGTGPSSNTAFKVKNVPIVDGSNGGVVTTTPTDVTVLVNDTKVAVKSLDGANGLVTLASPVTAGSTLTITYFYNHYQDTFDLLPGLVTALDQVGLGPNRADYIDGTDYVLDTDPISGNSTINWGASVAVKSATATPGFTAFDATVITATLVDEKVYLRPVTGVVNGKNAVFTLGESPTDGSGLSRTTDDPAKILVFIGSDPFEALASGAVAVTRLSGASGQFTLFNPPASGNVYATYYRSTLNDHTFTLNVAAAGITGQGTYKIVDESGDSLPTISVTGHSVADGNFNTTGIVFPSSFSDAAAGMGGKAEVITLTFRADSSSVITPALQAGGRLPSAGSNFISFLATTPGTAANSTQVVFSAGSAVADAGAVTVSGETITVNVTTLTSGVRSLGQIAALFAGGVLTPGSGINAQGKVFTTNAGIIIATMHGAGSTLATASTSVTFSGGAAEVDQTKSVSFTVTSSLGAAGTQGTGWLGQTFESSVTGVKFTIVDPASALSFGYTQLPSPQYNFAPADTLTFTVALNTARVTSATPTIDIPGLRLKVTSTFGMNTGDTATVETFNKAGDEPNVGEFYFVSYEVAKTAADFALQLFTNPAVAYALYGQPNVTNRVSLGVQLLTQNGAQVFGVIQVPKQTGLAVASDQDFIAAIQTLAVPLPQSDRKVDVIVPLTNSNVVQQFLSRHLTTQSNVRNKGEAIGFIGPSQYASSADIASLARSIANERVILIGDPVAAVQVNVSGQFVEYAVAGEFMAAAVAGLNVNPANDVAQSLVNQNVVGFSRLLKKFDDATMDIMSASGVTILTENNGALLLRDYLSTDPSSVLTSEPTATTVTDATRQRFRKGLLQFVGRKFLPTLISDVQATCNSLLRGLVSDELIEAYTQPVVTADASDPTVLHVTVSFKPIFTLKYIDVKFAIDTTL